MGYHYIPQFYLKGFEINGRLWTHDKQEGKSFLTQGKSIANEVGLYSDQLEKHLANSIEDLANPAISKIREKIALNDNDLSLESKIL